MRKNVGACTKSGLGSIELHRMYRDAESACVRLPNQRCQRRLEALERAPGPWHISGLYQVDTPRLKSGDQSYGIIGMLDPVTCPLAFPEWRTFLGWVIPDEPTRNEHSGRCVRTLGEFTNI